MPTNLEFKFVQQQSVLFENASGTGESFAHIAISATPQSHLRSFVPFADTTECTQCFGGIFERATEMPALSGHPVCTLDMLDVARQCVVKHVRVEFFWTFVDQTATLSLRAEDDYDYPEELPQVTLNRFGCARAREVATVAHASRCDACALDEARATALQWSVLFQMWRELGQVPTRQLRIAYTHPMDDGQARAFKVRLEGEGVEDYGGPYREAFEEVCRDLQNVLYWQQDEHGQEQQHTAEMCVLPLLAPSPNWRQQTHGSAAEELFVVSSAALSGLLRDLLRFLGQVLGIAIRSSLTLSLRLAPVVWKLLLSDKITDEDVRAYDEALATKLDTLAALAAQHIDPSEQLTVKEATSINTDVLEGQVWTVITADGAEAELCEGGVQKPVLAHQLQRYVDAAWAFKRSEFCPAVQCIREGLHSIVPAAALRALHWTDLREIVCGADVIDIERLKANTEYDDDGMERRVCIACIRWLTS
jgi:hypothetical protein